jgi:hypothetical protein
MKNRIWRQRTWKSPKFFKRDTAGADGIDFLAPKVAPSSPA